MIELWIKQEYLSEFLVGTSPAALQVKDLLERSGVQLISKGLVSSPENFLVNTASPSVLAGLLQCHVVDGAYIKPPDEMS